MPLHVISWNVLSCSEATGRYDHRSISWDAIIGKLSGTIKLLSALPLAFLEESGTQKLVVPERINILISYRRFRGKGV